MFNSELISNDLCNKGYHLIDNFLELEHYQTLCSMAHQKNQKGEFRDAKIGRTIQEHQNTSIRTDTIFWLDEHSENPAIQAYLNKNKALMQLFNQCFFLSLVEFETHFACYPPGSFYKRHIDQFSTNKSRKISCVYYLNPNWQKEFGGELTLYTKENQFLQNINPLGNRFICFNSELPHEVALTHNTRYSLAGWMKTRSF